MKSLIVLAFSVLVGAAALAQQPSAGESAAPDSLKGVKLKGKVPVNPRTLRVQLPEAQEVVLANGLRIALIEDHKLPTFSLQLILSGGGLADPTDKVGVAMATASLLDEGTKTRSSRDIAEQLATLGASFAAGASPSSGESVISVTGLTEHAAAILDVAADVVRNPAFSDAELAKFKARFLSQLQYQRSTPGFVAQETFMRAIYGEHPASHIVPPEPVLKALQRDDLVAYHANYYKPNNALLIVYGDFTLKALRQDVQRTFGSWQKGGVGPLKVPAPRAAGEGGVLLVDRPGSVQTSLWLGALGIERRSDDYFAVLVMNHILGGGPASRLFVNLREDKGYTYGVYSSFSGSKFPGVMVASTDVRTAVTEGAMHELTAEIRRIASEPVPAQELDNAKRALVGRFALSLESPQALLSNVATQKIYGLPADYWDTYPQRVEAITAADVQRVAKKYYDPQRLQIVAVGDGASIKATLEKYGKVSAPPTADAAGAGTVN